MILEEFNKDNFMDTIKDSKKETTQVVKLARENANQNT